MYYLIIIIIVYVIIQNKKTNIEDKYLNEYGIWLRII